MTSFTHPANEHIAGESVPFSPSQTYTPQTETRRIALADIVESPFNPRKDFDPGKLAELADSIKARGLLEPLVVRPPFQKGGKYELMAGHRRLRALKLNKSDECYCTVIEADDAQARATLIVENLQREDLGPMEEAEAFVALQKQDPKAWTSAAIAVAIGKTPRFVQQRLALATNLAPETAAAIKSKGLKIETARVLAGAPASLQAKVLDRNWNIKGMSADEAREALARHAVPESAAAFDVALYTGEWIDEGKKRLFADVAQFTRLQSVVAKAKLEALKKHWPDAQFVKESVLHSWKWGDNDERVSWKPERKKAAGTYSKAKCTALVWIDGQHRIHTAEGVKPEPKQAAVSHRSEPAYKETPERKVVREAFNRSVGTAYAKHDSAPLRLLLLDMTAGDQNLSITPALLKRALPTIAIKGHYLHDDAKAKLWPQFAALKEAAVMKAFLEIGRGLVDVNDKYSGFTWEDGQKACPALILAVGKTLGVAAEAEKPAAAPAPKPAAKKKTAKKAAKKKHQ